MGMGCAAVESRLSGLKLAFHAVWLAMIGVVCLVAGFCIVIVLDRVIRWKGYWNER